ncbi:MAG TPA: DEAD/DEAH box helicase [Kofleriaceae bacterium]|nr:DEAD/DEAH box helicase [Kofleriaceae bacterium]
MVDVLDAFHPLIAGWFRERFGVPTEPQRVGWPRISAREDVLIAAPTGSGKTLAAFLACLDDLTRRGFDQPLGDHTAILYISPLKALSNDVHRNLEGPLAELTSYAAARGERFPEIRVAVRTGDTPVGERAKLAKRPPHILVTTPESLYILLTTATGRAGLSRLGTVIVDEIHAVAGDKRGAHLALSLERLDRLVTQGTGRPPVRVGLSATQKPITTIARLLVGTRRAMPHIVDAGHRREIDLAIELTDDELGAVASNEQFGRIYDRIAELVTQHRSTIVFVNTRRLVERVAAALEQRLGEEHVVAHHGSMSRALRLAAEHKLKHGQVKCAVATASLELGIDVGTVDLVIQLGSPRSMATLLQRVGRSGHHLQKTPKGRLFALTRDQLVECAALIRGVRRGNLDTIALRDAPLDILAQQIVATTAAEEIGEDELAAMIRDAAPYADLPDARLEQVLVMLSEGVSDRRGRTGAHIHRDRIAGKLRGRRGARLAAILSGGAIPDNNNYAVVQWPEDTKVGEVDEDFAIDSSAGDIFQLGNTAWRIRRIEAGRVIVEDAKGQPPTIPYWFGEAPARTRELSDEVSDLRSAIDARLGNGEDPDLIAAWLAAEASMALRAAQQMVAYLAAGRSALGALPRRDLLIAERFFDEAGGMQLVLHAPLGGRINRAWGLALRKKFCRAFDFELQAAATDDGIVISLGQPHSFPLDTVFGFVPSQQVEATLVQALLDRPMFEIRWRWNVTRSLTVLRRRGGKRVPPHLVKMRAADTLSVVFPAAVACGENIVGDREIPDHPLVFETIRDCMVEAMDLAGLREMIERLERGEIQVIARDTVEPSPLSHELLNANPYAFLDDAPLEERRTRAVQLRRGLPAQPAGEDAIGTLDEAAITLAGEEVAPTVRDVDELHDALLGLWLVPEPLGERWALGAKDWFTALTQTGRACRLRWQGGAQACVAWVATERLGAVRAVLAGFARPGEIECTPMLATPSWSVVPEPDVAIVRIVGAHLDHRGPISARSLAKELGLPLPDIIGALLALEGDGAILRGSFTAAAPPAKRGAITAREALAAADDPGALQDLEWCNRRVLARIHRLTLARLRKEIEPVSAAALMRFVLRWQRVAKHTQLIGADGLARIVGQLQGFETAAGAWEREILPARLHGYDQTWLDQLCLAGQVVWCRLSPRRAAPDSEASEAPEAQDTPDHPEVSGDPAAGFPPDAERGANPAPGRPVIDPHGEPYNLAEAGAEAARLAGATREQIAAAAAEAIAGRCPAYEAQAIISLVTASAMLRRSIDDDRPDPVSPATSKSTKLAVAFDRARNRTPSARRVERDAADRERFPRGVPNHAGTPPDRRDLLSPDRAGDHDDFADPPAARPAEREPVHAGGPGGIDAREQFVLDTLALVRSDRDERRASVSRNSLPRPKAPDPRASEAAPQPPRANRSAPSRSAPLSLILRQDASWLRAAAAVGQTESANLSPQATRVRDHLATAGASFLADLVATIDLLPDEIEDALWELVGAGLATADGFASLRVLVSRRRGEVKSHFDRRMATMATMATTATPGSATPVRKWQDAIRKARTRDRERPGHALRSLPTAAGRWSLLPSTDPGAIDAEASARQLLHRYGVVFRDLLPRESSLPPWRDLLVALRRLEARGEIRGGRFVTGFVGEQFALPEALDELRGVRNPGPSPDVCRVAATDPTNLVGILSPGPRVPAIVGNLVLYIDGHAVASLEAGRVVLRAPIPAGARIDDDLTYHPPPRAAPVAMQAALPL